MGAKWICVHSVRGQIQESSDWNEKSRSERIWLSVSRSFDLSLTVRTFFFPMNCNDSFFSDWWMCRQSTQWKKFYDSWRAHISMEYIWSIVSVQQRQVDIRRKKHTKKQINQTNKSLSDQFQTIRCVKSTFFVVKTPFYRLSLSGSNRCMHGRMCWNSALKTILMGNTNTNNK